MPRKLILAVWKEQLGDTKPRLLKNHFEDQLAALDPAVLEAFKAARKPFDDQTLDTFAAPFAERFLVSRQAMRIRLERIGLLRSVWSTRQSRIMA